MRVESIRPYAGQIDPHRELELLDAWPPRPIARCWPLADGVARIFRAGWAIVLAEPVDGHGTGPRAAAAPPPRSSDAARAVVAAGTGPRAGRRRGVGPARTGTGSDTELAIAPLGTGALLVGRPALRWLPSELVRLRHLAAIAATVTAAG